MTGKPAAADPSEANGILRPRRADVVASYDLGVARYDELWSPVILPAAVTLVPWLSLGDGDVVLDVGGGTGALTPVIRSAAPAASVVVLDASVGMLRVAHHRRGVPAAQADAMLMPVVSDTVDAVVLAYVLFHLADPLAALVETARVLRPGGRVGTATWRWERTERAQTIWDEALRDAGVPPLPPRRVDSQLDNPDGLRRLVDAAGLRVERVWTERLARVWNAESFWALTTGCGQTRQRLASVDPALSDLLLQRFRATLDALEPEAFRWEGEVLCAIATKPRWP